MSISISSPEDGVVGDGGEVVTGGGWCQIRRSSMSRSCDTCSRVRMRCVSVCASEEGGPPGRCAGEQPVASSTFGTSRFSLAISCTSSLLLCLSSSLFVSWGRPLSLPFLVEREMEGRGV